MHQTLSKICRICMCDGSRNIFEKQSTRTSTQFAIPTVAQNVSSLDRLLEKLRYVTMMKIDESENLPKFLCDSCIIQLNVAYNFKRNAVESDVKIRQYIIEYGMSINPNQYALQNVNNLLLPANNFVAPPSPASSNGLQAHNGAGGSVNGSSTGSQNGHTEDQSSSRTTTETHPFPVVPMIIKEEPVDFETLSDITIDTNTDAFVVCDERLHCRTDLTPSAAANGPTKTPINGSMVTLNDKSLLISTASSDVDYISAYLPTPSVSEHSPVASTTSSVQTVQSHSSRSNASGSAQKSNDELLPKRTRSSIADGSGKRRTRESTASNIINTTDAEIDEKPNRRSLQRQLGQLSINMLTDQRAPVRFDQRGSRIKDGVLQKKDYHSFYRNRRKINPLNKDARNEIKQNMLSRTRQTNRQPQRTDDAQKPVRTRKIFEAPKRSAVAAGNAMASMKRTVASAAVRSSNS